MKKIFAFILILGFQCGAFANVAGDWTGWGDWTYEGTGDHCQVQMSFQQTTQTLTREKASFVCNIVQMDSPPVTWNLQGQSMLLDGAIVGQWDENSFTATEKYSPSINIKMVMKVQDQHADYSEVWSDDKGQVLYNIQARLFRKP